MMRLWAKIPQRTAQQTSKPDKHPLLSIAYKASSVGEPLQTASNSP